MIGLVPVITDTETGMYVSGCCAWVTVCALGSWSWSGWQTWSLSGGQTRFWSGGQTRFWSGGQTWPWSGGWTWPGWSSVVLGLNCKHVFAILCSQALSIIS